MPPLPPESTQRYWVDYHTCGYDHSLLCRTNSDVTPADAGTTIAAFIAAIQSNFRLIEITGFRGADSGSNLSFPMTWPGAGTYGSGAGQKFETAQYWDFVGRGPTGKRVRVGLFGAISPIAGDNYRVTPAESAAVSAGLAELVSDSNIFLDISYGTPIWNNYANCGVSAYWRNKIR